MITSRPGIIPAVVNAPLKNKEFRKETYTRTYRQTNKYICSCRSPRPLASYQYIGIDTHKQCQINVIWRFDYGLVWSIVAVRGGGGGGGAFKFSLPKASFGQRVLPLPTSDLPSVFQMPLHKICTRHQACYSFRQDVNRTFRNSRNPFHLQRLAKPTSELEHRHLLAYKSGHDKSCMP